MVFYVEEKLRRARETNDAEILAAALGKSTSPITEHAKEMQRDELKALVTQVERLYTEEMKEKDDLDE